MHLLSLILSLLLIFIVFVVFRYVFTTYFYTFILGNEGFCLHCDRFTLQAKDQVQLD